MAVAILMVSELRDKDPVEIKQYKKEIIKAQSQAPTDFEREKYSNQLERVNQVLNEVDTEEAKFRLLVHEIETTIAEATD